MSECLDMIVDHHAAICSISPSYPEASMVTVRQVKHLLKKNKFIRFNGKLASKAKLVISKIQEQSAASFSSRSGSIFDMHTVSDSLQPIQEFSVNCRLIKRQQIKSFLQPETEQ